MVIETLEFYLHPCSKVAWEWKQMVAKIQRIFTELFQNILNCLILSSFDYGLYQIVPSNSLNCDKTF